MKYILLGGLLTLLLSYNFIKADKNTITGVVKDDAALVLAGVTVGEKGTGNMVLTDDEGRFSIKVSNEKATLIFSYIGFETKEVKLSGKTYLEVELSGAVKLEEVVVAGYAPQPKRIRSASIMLFTAPKITADAAEYKIAEYESMPPAEDRSELFNTEGYDGITENGFLAVKNNPLSTFSIDVDAASYSNVRRFLKQGQLPPAGSVRIEEMINYFQYSFPQPTGEHPFAIHTEIATAPWNEKHQLVMVNLQGKKIPAENLPASNLVFLIDVSGSMEDYNKLPLVKQSMKLLTDQLRENDRVAIVVYAGSAGLVLPSTSGSNKQAIKDAIDNLQAGGSTAGGAGTQLAYKVARDNFKKDGNNRVILCSDGDFNVGASSDAAMETLIEKERASGVYLTVLGYGMGNYKDNKMQKLASKGNGNHAYIDDANEAKKVLVNEFGGTLFTIAKDVKLQVEFNPAKVQAYRLIGYENRMLKSEDFNNDKKDAGELGSGHSVTAFYEVIPVGVKSDFVADTDKLKYQTDNKGIKAGGNELMTVKFRYKKPDENTSRLIEHPMADMNTNIRNTSDNFRFAAAVAQFGMLLRNSEYKQAANYNSVLALANSALNSDAEGYRKEFVQLVNEAGMLSKNSTNEDKESVSKH